MKIFTKTEPIAKSYWLNLAATQIKDREEKIAKLADDIKVVDDDLEQRLAVYRSYPWFLRLFIFKPTINWYDTMIDGVQYCHHDNHFYIQCYKEKLVELHRIQKSLKDRSVEYVELSVKDLNSIGY